LVCLSIVLSSPIIVPVSADSASQAQKQDRKKDSGNDKARKVKPTPPDKGRPKLTLPNLDEIRGIRENHPEIKPAIASSVRNKRKPMQKWDGRKVGDPGTTGSRPQASGKRSDRQSARGGNSDLAASRFNHSRKSRTAAPPLPDDAFVQSFIGNALGRGINGTEQTYWDDVLRAAYYQGQDSLLTASREMGRTIFQSAEYYNRGRSNHEYVYDLYMTYLMRDPSNPYDGGWDFWTSICDAYGREAVRAAFDESGEFSNLVAALTPNGGITGGVGSIASARVDPFNQSGDQTQARDCEWSLPLISLPGRAGLDLGLGISYSSLIYTRSGPYLYFDEDISQISPGFHLGFAAIQGPSFDPASSRKVYLLVAAAGRRAELRQVGSSNVYEAGDSSYLQLTDNGNNTLTLRTTDGTQINYSRYASDWQATQIKDRNGNYLAIDNDWRGDIHTITDTLGRVIYFNNDGNGNLSSITQYTGGGWHTWATFGWGSPHSMSVWNMSGVVGTYHGESIPVLRQVNLMDGSYYTFEYTGVGQVNIIRRYSSDNAQRSYMVYDYEGTTDDSPRIYQTRVWGDGWGGSPGVPWEVATQFNLPGDGSHQMVTPDGTTYREYYGSGWQNGLVTLAQVYSGGLQKWTTTSYTQDNTGVNYQTNPRATETNVYDAAGNRRRTTVEYHTSFGLPHYIVDYAADGYNWLRRTHVEYKFDSQYIDRRIIGLPFQREVYDNNWTMMERTQYQYDWGGEYLQDLAAAPTQHDGGYNTGFISGRGNLTSVQRYDVTDAYNTSKIHEVQTGYDVAGNLRFSRDASGHTASVSYNDTFSDGGNWRNTFAYPTTLTDADGYSSYQQYHYDFGAKTRTEGPPPAGQPYGAIQYFYYDGAVRLYEIYNGNSGAVSYFAYGPNYTQTWTSTNSQYDNYSFTYFDGLGRTTVASNYHPSTGTYGTQLTYYDVMGRVSQQSNPTEMYGNWSPSADEAGGWIYTYQTYDWKGRQLVTTNQDGTQKYASYSACGCAGSEVTTLTDEAGRQQKFYSDVLGRRSVTQVLNWNGTSSSTTTNTFNARDQITNIQQTDSATSAYQNTVMTYDGYGRLYTRHLPEQNSGTATVYTYRADDTTETVTDARGATTTYNYNNRHQVNAINYTAPAGVGATPNVAFSYDAAGNRSWMTDGLGRIDYVYDSLSRMTSETRHFDLLGQNYQLQYQYNLGNQVSRVTDPYGASAIYTYDGAARLLSVTGSGYLNGGTEITQFATDIQYRAFGEVKHLVNGDASDKAQFNLSFNSRKELTRFEAGGRVTEHDYFADGRPSYVRDYHFSNFNRTYQYDHAGRLSHATAGESSNWHVNPYSYDYTYDAWEHVSHRSGHHWSGTPDDFVGNFSNNRNVGWTYQGFVYGAWRYDADGNQTGTNTYLPEDKNYDAGERLSTYRQLENNEHYVVSLYSYDGDGRVGRTTGYVEGSSPGDSGQYYIYSTVLGGQPLVRLNKGYFALYAERIYIYANGEAIAYQSHDYNGGSSKSITWLYQNPVTSSHYERVHGTPNNWAPLEDTIVDPMGGDVRDYDPYLLPEPPAPGPHPPTESYSETSNFNGGCYIDGAPALCEELMNLANNGAAKSVRTNDIFAAMDRGMYLIRETNAVGGWVDKQWVTRTAVRFHFGGFMRQNDQERTAVIMPGATDEQEKRIQAGFSLAKKILKTNKKCADFFGGAEKALQVLDFETAYQVDQSIDPDKDGHPTAASVIGATYVYLNPIGFIFDESATINLATPGSKLPNPEMSTITLTGEEAAAFAFFHETAHKTHGSRFGGTDKDYGKGDKYLLRGYQNNWKIWNACFSGAKATPRSGGGLPK